MHIVLPLNNDSAIHNPKTIIVKFCGNNQAAYIIIDQSHKAIRITSQSNNLNIYSTISFIFTIRYLVAESCWLGEVPRNVC